MDRLNGRQLAIGVALAFAFAGTGVAANGADRASSDASASTQADVRSTDGAVSSSDRDDVTTAPNATPSSNPATSYDTGTTSPYSGALGEKSTPPASDEDHDDQGAYPPAPPHADTSNVPPQGYDSSRDDARRTSPVDIQSMNSSQPSAYENNDQSASGQG
ncbi:MAG TPA: hypothetical protein VN782_14085 [Usitatibacter sp.]|nr:hypothetical protein [Usitatibacter sp.]